MNEAQIQIRKEDARRETLRFLAERHQLAHEVSAVRRGVNRAGFDFDDTEILAALDILIGLGLVQGIRAPLGATFTFKATAKGVLEHERY